MADTTQPGQPVQLESGTYEILRSRLKGHASELRARLQRLNEDRKQVFGSVDFRLLATDRVTTAHNCVPRDMVAIGNRFLFGFNVHFGLKSERHIADVFACYAFHPDSHTFQEAGLESLQDPRFLKDFQDVYRYYKDATFARFHAAGPHLYMVFQVGKSVQDIKSFKWLIVGDELRYLDNRSDHEVKFPPQHEFEWKRTTRDHHRQGSHPHVSIEDRLFVETVGGDLTIKIENNTDSGEGIYAEPVDNRDQTLDDAEIHYAIVGNIILLRIRPYQEPKWRHIVFNEKMRKAQRLDSIQNACILLPDDHGLIFANGFYLQTGEQKVFDSGIQGLVFERRIASPNGEDTLFVFYQPEQGIRVLLGYNLIAQTVDTPIVCHGFTMFRGGQMILFKAHHEPQKHHPIQIWQTPYVGEDFQAPPSRDSYLYKIGNREIVRAMAECQAILSLVDKEDSYAGLYLDLVKLSTDLLDSYFWINHDEAANLAGPLREIKAAAAATVDEFEKVVRVRKNTRTATDAVAKKTRDVLNDVGRRQFNHIDPFVKSLAALRGVRGEIIGLRELRHVDGEIVKSLEQEVAAVTDKVSQRTVEFLLREGALAPYEQAVAAEQQGIALLTKVSDARAVDEKVAASARELEMLIEIVSNLKIDDATRRTAIIDNISAIFSTVNAARSALKRKIRELAAVEGAAEFSSQLKLLNQSVVNYIDISETPEKCEEFLTKLLVQIEELEGKFAEFDDFVVELAEKREEIAGAFESRRMQLLERRNKRAEALAQAADRILKGVKTRVESFASINEIHGYFAADLMIEKVRNIIAELEQLGDSVKVDDLQSRLKTVREDAVRQLKDKQELFEDGRNVIRFGKRRFSVNTQALDLTTILREGTLQLHLTGTNFYEPPADEALQGMQDVWSMEVPSENGQVYRAEYLAFKLMQAVRNNEVLLDPESDLLLQIQQFMGSRYREGYLKGVHDHDAALLLEALLEMDATCGLLRYPPAARALASLCWWHLSAGPNKKLLEQKLAGFGAVARAFPGNDRQLAYIRELRRMLEGAVHDQGWPADRTPNDDLFDDAAEYLFRELTDRDRGLRSGLFVISQRAADLVRDFLGHLKRERIEALFADSMKGVQKDLAASLQLARDWLGAFVPTLSTERQTSATEDLDEAALLLVGGPIDERAIVSATLEQAVTGFTGSHPMIADGRYVLRYHEFIRRLSRFEAEVVPRYERYHALKTAAVERTREEMKLTEFQPKVLTSFVRNRLIDQVYLPLIGDNLAKQIGSAGEGKRTDRQGLLLLISPPGYGKTTLMEYIANRLGLIFMKINGPAIGHEVTSVDPGAAPNAGAREEIQKLNLAFEMGDNVMIYLDDIQHCHPEFLQKFISLCDAQRKIEGVYKGKTRTYDFRGKRVAVVMAGNPYTESGEKFKIPDMLANRADIYNLGEIIGDTRDAFEMSYLENALTSNPVLARLASRSQKDVAGVIQLAEQSRRVPTAGTPASVAGFDFEGSYSAEELNEFVSVMVKLMQVRDVVLTVNREYIASAAQHDDYRTEPPFLLQGSYRNMNRITEKVLPVMNDQELQTLIVGSYQNDAQTLTSGTESNLLKFKELFGLLTPDETQRWEDIRRTFRQNVKLRGIGAEDKVGQVVAALSTFADGLDAIRKAVSEGVAAVSQQDDASERQRMELLSSGLTSLAEKMSTSLAVLEQIASRPVEVNVPTVEMNWPSEGIPMAPVPVASAEATSFAPQQITVVNRLPKTVYGVIESQFSLMEHWLKPLTELAARQHTELTELRPMVEQCLRSYRQLLSKLEEAHAAEE